MWKTHYLLDHFPIGFPFVFLYVYPRVSSNIDPAFEAFEIDHDDHDLRLNWEFHSSISFRVSNTAHLLLKSLLFQIY
jgi:hypothetical protein